MRKPRALRPGDRVAVVAPASPFKRDEFDAGVAELRDARLRTGLRRERLRAARVCRRAPPTSAPRRSRAPGRIRRSRRSSRPAAATAASRCCRCSTARSSRRSAKAFIGYSDNTSLLTWLTLQCGIVSFHGPMIEGRLARGAAGYDRDTFARCLCRAEPAGEIVHPQLEVDRAGRGDGHAARRHADAADGVARHAVRVRSA